MTPKEKAKELLDKYINLYPSYIVMFQGDVDKAEKDIKQCALIAVNEVLYVLNEIDSSEQWNASYFYNQVKQEIEKL